MSHINLSISGCVTGAQVWISEVCVEHNVCVCVCVFVCVRVCARARGTCVDVMMIVFECMRKTYFLCVQVV